LQKKGKKQSNNKQAVLPENKKSTNRKRLTKDDLRKNWDFELEKEKRVCLFCIEPSDPKFDAWRRDQRPPWVHPKQQSSSRPKTQQQWIISVSYRLKEESSCKSVWPYKNRNEATDVIV
uniref:Uncharacterized protein n=1 Tax=Romanomermis culicivorax TaxID=13658 RepID=A0A915HS06_ROMCU